MIRGVIMKTRNLYSILKVAAVVVVTASLVAILPMSSLIRRESMLAAGKAAANRIRGAIKKDLNYIVLDDISSTWEKSPVKVLPREVFMRVHSVHAYTPSSLIAVLGIPRNLKKVLTKFLPRKMHVTVYVIVYNATQEEMNQIGQKIETIEHLSELPIQVFQGNHSNGFLVSRPGKLSGNVTDGESNP